MDPETNDDRNTLTRLFGTPHLLSHASPPSPFAVPGTLLVHPSVHVPGRYTGVHLPLYTMQQRGLLLQRAEPDQGGEYLENRGCFLSHTIIISMSKKATLALVKD